MNRHDANSGKCTMKKLLKRARSAFVPGTVILLYHRVAELSTDPQLLGVRPSRFLEHLEVCRKMAKVIPLQSLVKSLDRGKIPNREIVITFDDGYSDNLHSAKPLLERHEIPASVFVSTGSIGSDRELWWDELERIFLGPRPLPGELKLQIDGTRHEWKLNTSTGNEENHLRDTRSWNLLEKNDPSLRHSIFRSLCTAFGPLPGKERQRLLDELRVWAGMDSAGRPSHRPLTRNEILKLAQGGLVEIGAHTVTHPVLSFLSEQEQRAEIKDSKSRLEEILGNPVTSFSYPFGLRDDYSATTVSIVKESGFDCACANCMGIVRPKADRFQLPRVVVRDWDGDEFSRWLKEWFCV
jgi:peptidoglycan/xylan/chitin deacetylase (PgdA/CDA1 family)